MTGHEFARQVAVALALEPLSEREADDLLDVAGVAAHASERLAAPLTTYLAGRSGRPLDDVRAAVARVSEQGERRI